MTLPTSIRACVLGSAILPDRVRFLYSWPRTVPSRGTTATFLADWIMSARSSPVISFTHLPDDRIRLLNSSLFGSALFCFSSTPRLTVTSRLARAHRGVCLVCLSVRVMMYTCACEIFPLIDLCCSFRWPWFVALDKSSAMHSNNNNNNTLCALNRFTDGEQALIKQTAQVMKVAMWSIWFVFRLTSFSCR